MNHGIAGSPMLARKRDDVILVESSHPFALGRRLFYAGLIFVVACSLYDAYLVFHFREVINEENLFCRWLISLEPEFVSVFLVAKLSGTAMVGGTLYGLWSWMPRVAMPTVLGLVAFQCGLLSYLHGYDPLPARKAQVAQSLAEQAQRRHHAGHLARDLEPLLGTGQRMRRAQASRVQQRNHENRLSSDRTGRSVKFRDHESWKEHDAVRHHQRIRRFRNRKLRQNQLS